MRSLILSLFAAAAFAQAPAVVTQQVVTGGGAATCGSPDCTVPGTLHGVGAATFDSTVSVSGTLSQMGCSVSAGTGSPEGVVTGSVCDIWKRTNGSTGTVLYVKESGTATNTGWVAYGAGGGGGGTWGSITGTLSSQTDLNTALGLKAPLISPSFTTPSLGVATATSMAITPAADVATLGSNLATDMSGGCGVAWTCGTNWAIAASVATHTTGNTAALTASVTIPSTGWYEVAWTTGSSPAGSLTIGIGASSTVLWLWAQSDFEIRKVNVQVASTGAQTLTFTPSSTYNGTVSAVTVKLITQLASASVPQTIKNADGTAGVQIYAGGAGLYNTFVGNGASPNNYGNYNTSLGAQALAANAAGVANTAIGAYALVSNTSGTSNVCVGYNTCTANTNGSENTAVGIRALAANTTGYDNTCIGIEACQNQTTASGNVAVGLASQLGATGQTGSSNVSVGNGSLKFLSTGSDNVGVGASAGLAVTTGLSNVFVGGNAGAANTTGSSNVAVGNQALSSHTTVSEGTAVGHVALRFATGGDNTAIGYGAGAYNHSGGSTNKVTTGSHNLFLGAHTQPGSTTQRTYLTIIGPDAIGECDNCIVLGRGSDLTHASGYSGIAMANVAEGGCTAATDLVVDGTTNTIVTSVSYTFVANDVNGHIDITAGSGWTTGRYRIIAVSGGAATLSISPGAVSITGGTFSVNRGRITTVYGGVGVADTLHICRKDAANAYAWTAMASM